MNEPVGSRGSRPPARAVARTFVFLVATLPAAEWRGRQHRGLSASACERAGWVHRV